MSGAFVETLKMIKIEHSLFALPFALVSAFWAAGGLPPARILILIVIAMVFARSAAMAFNRYLDAEIDTRNPRTANRSIPAGRLSRVYALGFTLAAASGFLLTAFLINDLTLALAPFMLLVLLGYSFTKRFTSYCHFVLGLALGLAPLGAWVAVTGKVSPIPFWLGAAVLCWTAGFDIIYACQDIDFDRQTGLKSVPARIGIHASLFLSRLLHGIMAAILIYLGLLTHAAWPYWLGIAIVAGAIVYEHSLVWGGNLEKVDMAFFTMNGVVSLVYGFTTIAAVLIA